MTQTTAGLLVDRDLAAHFCREILDLWQGRPSLAKVQDAAHRAGQWAAYCLDLLETASPLPRPVVCGPGCDLCCHNQVELTAPEALRLGQYLADRFSSQEQRLLLERVAWLRDRQAGRSRTELAATRAEFPCPFLRDHRCLVYEVRPLMCRAMHSLDAAACREEFDHPALRVVPFYSHRHVIHVSLSQGLVDACLALGLRSGPVELLWAVQTCLTHPDAASSWLAGEAVFAADRPAAPMPAGGEE